jgi:hypothetical protein
VSGATGCHRYQRAATVNAAEQRLPHTVEGLGKPAVKGEGAPGKPPG